VNVCSRAAAGTVFPGDEAAYYTLNPGEGFAESYRVLNETSAGGTSFDWSVVSRGFYPDQTALEDIRQDVLAPWSRPTSRSFRGRLATTGVRVWSQPLATPLDGDLSVSLKLPAGSAADVALLGPAGEVLAQGFWSGAGRKALTYKICGLRSVVLQVARVAGRVSFSVQVTVP
jgi:hypothetical protein